MNCIHKFIKYSSFMTERCSKYSHFPDKSNKVKGLKCNYREERSQEKFLEEEEYS